MGAETAPVAGSTRWPACTARVSIFMSRGEVTNSERIVDPFDFARAFAKG